MNTDTGEFHDLANKQELDKLAGQLGVRANEVVEKVRKIGWMELSVGEIVELKGHNFRVLKIENSEVTLQNVKFVVDPALKR